MKIDTIKTYRSGFKMLSTTLIIVVIISLIGLGAFGFLMFTQSQEGYKSVWIIDPKSKQVFKANQVLGAENPERAFEYKNHVAMFYKYWYEFDQYTFQASIDKGLQLIGNSGKTMKNDYETQSYQRKLSEKNMKLTISIPMDSIFINMNTSPVTGVAHAIQTIESPAGKIIRRMNSKFKIYDLAGRSNENPHGCLIDNFEITDDSRIERYE